MLESEIQTKIIKELEADGWIVLRSISNSKSGYPDVQGIKNGRVVFIEVKQPGKQPSTLQQYRHNQLREHGMEVFVMRSVNDIELLSLKQSSLSGA